MQRPFPPLAVALALCAFAASSPEARADLRITEIMFQAAPIDGREPVEREFIEITNTGVEAVNLDGYELDRGVDYTFGSVQIPAQGRLVVASDVAAFQSVYPGVTNVVGPWTGNLSNSGEEIRLVDFNGDTADRVEYFDQGDWAVRRRGPNDGGHRGWVWENLADGGGRSLELITLSLSNNAGQNWAPSAADGGTPGAANSVAAANIAPLIRDAGHSPAVPTSADPIYFTARIEDEEAGAAVALFWRSHSNTSPGSFVALPMADDGQSGDGAAGDGVFGTSIPPQPNGLVIEFYFRAGDVGGRSRTWPGPTDESGTQGANCLLQVDNENYAGGQPIYRMILSGTERDEFFNGFNAGSDAQMNATFIASYGGQTALRYVGGTRRRGAGSRGRSPVGVRLNLARDRPFNGDSRLNLNTQYTYSQVVGHLLHGAAGLEGADGTAVQVRWNGENQAVNGSLMYGSYAHMEPLSGEWVDDHLPEDNGGTLYKKIRPDNSWAYRNGNISAYRSDGWIQQTNEGDGDSSWDGLDNLMRAMNSDAGSPTYLSDVAEVADLDQWMRWFGVMALLANGETNASNGADDDYAMYESGVDGRFIFIAHDLDTILSNGDGSRITDPEHTIFDMIERGDVLEPLVPLFQRPEIIRLYYQTLRDLIDGPFSKPEFDELVQNHLGGWVDQDEIDSIIDYMDARRTYVDGIVSGSYSAGTDLSASQGYPRTTDGGLTLSGTTDISGVGSVTVNGEPAALTFARGGGTWSLAIGGLTGETQILSPRKSNWKYLDNGSDQGTAWRQPGFNDSGWQQGDAELGYGDEARQTTIVSYGPNAGNKYLTTYFRRTFTIADPADYASLQALVQFDDGFALYLNGQEIARDNLAANAAYNDPATSTVVPSQETVFNQYGASAAFLQAGTNTLAAEVHNLAPDNPDLAFDMELVATVNSESSDPLLARPGINKFTVEYWDTEGNRVGSEEIDVWFDDGSVETISGTIASNRTLNASGGPYLLNGDVTVPAGVTLTIQPGTTVYFQPTNGRLTVRGKLVAEGTEYARIRFALQPGQTANYQGVRFIDTDEENILANVDMRSGDAQGECILIDNSRVTLDGMTWADVDDTIVEVDSPKAIIKNSAFPSVNSSEVIHGNNLAGDDFFILDGNSFGATGGYNDIIDFTGGRRPGPIIQVYNNVFHGASDDVLDLDGTDGHIEGNLFMNVHQDQPRDSLSSAIATDTNSDLTVVRNVFYDVDHALLLKNGSRATFTNNTVVNATLSGIAFDEPQRSGVTPGSAAAVDGCIFWNCTVAFSDLVSVPPETNPVLTVDRCILPVEFHALGTGNLWADPHLIAPGGDQRDDYAIQPGSAAAGRGPNGLDIGALVPAGASISGLPSSPTHLTGATIVVGGPGITHYKRRFSGGNWGAETPVSDPWLFGGLGAGTYRVEVVGKNSAGVWQEFAEATVSPNWTVQPGAGGVVINEVLAINRSLPLGSAGTTDYIELTNTGGTAVDLSGYSLTDDPSAPAQFVFPGGTSLAPGGYAVVYAGAAPGGAGFFAPFALSGEGESVYLYNASSQLVDTVAFGPQVADHSVGRIGRDRAWDLALPSPGAANAAAPQCPPDAIVLNEWLAANNVRITNDFVELYNPLPLPCPLAGLRLGDSIRPAESDHVIAPLSFCAGEGFAVFWADGDGKNGPEGAGENAAHLRFKLDSNYEWLGLYSAAGDQMDLVHFQSQSKDVSVGRSPDGTTGQYQALVVPTPGATNATTSENGPGDPTPVTFTAMTDTFRYNDNDVDYYNASPAFYERTFDASSWPQGAGPFGVDSDLGSGAFGTSLDLNPPTTHYIRGTFTFNGDLSRLQNIELRTFVDDGAIFYLNGTEIHRMQMPGGDISHEDFASRSNPNGDPTVEGPFSVPANLIVNGINVLAASVHQDDGSSGDVGIGMSLTGELAAEPDPDSEIRYAEMVVLADSLRITEIFFNPPGSGDDLEFIELQNTGGSTLTLGGVRLSGAVEFTFPEMDLPPGDTVVVVANRPVFELTFGSAMRIAGEYSGRLSNGGEKIRLQLPDPYIANILSFDYNDAWYPATDGGGSSLRFAGSLSSSPLEAWDDAAYWEENPTPDPGGFTAQVIDDFPSWSAANAVTGADGDEDHDGIAHLVEYGLLLSPNDGSGANGPAGLPIIGTSPDNRATLTFEVPSTPWGDLAYAVEASSSVHGPWITIKQKAAGATQWTGLGITSVSAGSAGRDRVTVADLPTIGGANTRRFLRLRFILQ